MVTETLQMDRLLMAFGVVLGALLIGFGLRVLLGRLERRAEGTEWAWDDLAVTMVRALAVPAFGAAGVWATVLLVDLRADLRRIVGSILVAVLIVMVSLAAARLAAGLVGSIAQGREGDSQSASIFVNITRAVVVGIGVLVLLQSLGVSITPLLGALGVGGLAVALALQDTLANLFAGVHILASKKVHQGDYVALDSGQEGYVVDINWRNTTIREIQGNLIVVPNSRFADAIMTNYHRPQQDMTIVVPVGVGRDSDLDHVERVTVDVAREVLKEVDGGVSDYEPLVRFNGFGESSIDFSVILCGREFSDQYLLVHEFIKRLHRRYDAEEIQIPFPIRTLVWDNPTGNGRRLGDAIPRTSPSRGASG
ncbi:MAG TPA: mechanosensitive ion channel family protein [Streptosporangiaceae bacterium]|nr:mechanosensitive ion channel family protein [Streptosporangiaceae bacterium]